MADNYLRASNGAGEAVMAVVTTPRDIGSTILITDSVLNWPARGIATSGDLDHVTGLIDPDTATVFKYHLDGSIITIDEFAPGYPDVGNTENQVVVLKPTTLWADLLAEGAAGGGGANVHIGPTPPPDAEEGDLWGDTSEEGLNEIVRAVGSMLMPVGHIIITHNSANPATYWGFGTWEQQKDRIIIGVGDDPDWNAAGDTYGEKDHTLTVDEMPSHTHIQNSHSHVIRPGAGIGTSGSGYGLVDSGNSRSTVGANAPTASTTATNQSTGGDQAHNNMPPVQAEYIWKRVA